MLEKLIFEIQTLFPQIYLACHVDHVRSSSTHLRLSSHDSSILAHLKLSPGTGPRSLAAHLGVAPSTLSATLKRLSQLGYIENVPQTNDKRKRILLLTKRGSDAIRATSVLDEERVGFLLEKLSLDERGKAVEGLALLASAARKLTEDDRK